MSEESQAVAIKAALNAVLDALSTPRAAYESDDLAKLESLPAAYVELFVTRRFGGTERNAGGKGREGWRIGTRGVAQTVTNARLMLAKTAEALEEVRLTVDGIATTPIKFESAEVVGPDDGWYSGLVLWTYSH